MTQFTQQYEQVLEENELPAILSFLRQVLLHRMTAHLHTDGSKTSHRIQAFVAQLDMLEMYAAAAHEQGSLSFLHTLSKLIGPQKKNPTARLIYRASADEAQQELDSYRQQVNGLWSRVLLHARSIVREQQQEAQ